MWRTDLDRCPLGLRTEVDGITGEVDPHIVDEFKCIRFDLGTEEDGMGLDSRVNDCVRSLRDNPRDKM